MDENKKNPDGMWEVKEHRKSRSLDSNNYFYLLVNKIAKKQNISDTEVHDRFLAENIEYFTNDDGGIDWKVSPQEPNAYGLIKEQVNGNFEYYKDSGMTVLCRKNPARKSHIRMEKRLKVGFIGTSKEVDRWTAKQ